MKRLLVTLLIAFGALAITGIGTPCDAQRTRCVTYCCGLILNGQCTRVCTDCQ